VVFVGAIALIPSREIAPQTDVAAATVTPETPAAQPAHAKAETRADARSAAKDPKKKTPGDPVGNAAVEPVGALVSEGAPVVPAAEPIQSRPIEHVAAVTITGCLEHDEESFWLKDTTGLDAPTSRSWKSGFLKKRPSRIELLDPNNSLKLPAYVGRRISATGTLVNREMQPRSLHPLGVSCS
jgi:hypothetical protein